MTDKIEPDLSERIADALRGAEQGSELNRVLQKWEGFNFTVRNDGEWLLEGFVNIFQNALDLARAVDPSFPTQLPPRCFDPDAIAKFFRLPADAFSEYRQQQPGGAVLTELHQMVKDIHETTVEGPQQRLARLSPMERDLYDAASEDEPLTAAEVCARTAVHFLDSRTKQCLSNLVKFGLLRKAQGRRGYLRVPFKS